MKLQYLGDARDAFKWDLLHWICTKSSPCFQELAFVPMLTPDIAGSTEGLTRCEWFACRDFIRQFAISLKAEPRSLTRIESLGSAEPNVPPFDVSVFAHSELLASGIRRSQYWNRLNAEKFKNAVVFFDPDNGFETNTRHGPKWVRHKELRDLFCQLPKSSVAVVYQHRPRRKWSDLFADLESKLGYVTTVVAVYERNLAFVVMVDNPLTAKRVLTAIQTYTSQHPVVRYTVLKDDDVTLKPSPWLS